MSDLSLKNFFFLSIDIWLTDLKKIHSTTYRSPRKWVKNNKILDSRPNYETLGHTRLRRRADKHCGSNVALASKQHRVINRRFTRIHRSSLTPHYHHRKRLQLKWIQFRRVSIDCSRSHPSPFIASTERKTSREPSPLTMVELRSSSNVVSTNPNQTKSEKN